MSAPSMEDCVFPDASQQPHTQAVSYSLLDIKVLSSFMKIKYVEDEQTIWSPKDNQSIRNKERIDALSQGQWNSSKEKAKEEKEKKTVARVYSTSYVATSIIAKKKGDNILTLYVLILVRLILM